MNTTISSSLTTNSERYARYGRTSSSYYYEAFEVTVFEDGYYVFTSNSSIDTYGYLYNQSFSPNIPSRNLLRYNDDSGDGLQFQFIVHLDSTTKYVLVVTTYGTYVTGAYILVASGSNTLNLVRIHNISTISTTTRPRTTTGKLIHTMMILE